MTYVVFGSTGKTGRVVAETLLAAGKKVRAVVRNEAKAAQLQAKGASLATANLEDAGSVRAALEGAEAAYFLVPPDFATGDFRAYQRRVGDAIAEATRAANLKEAVLLSSVGAELPSGTGPIQGLHYAEQKLQGGPTKFAFLRAAYFLENLGGSLSLLAKGLFPTFSPKELVLDMVATRDVGEAAASLLLEGVRSTHAVNVTSGRYSASDVANVLGGIAGKRIDVAEAPVNTMAETLVGFGFPPGIAALYQEMTEGMNAGRVRFDPSVQTIRGKTKPDAVLRAFLNNE